MCGITGFWLTSRADHSANSIRAMTDALAHRGPDSQGFWHDQHSVVHLGHRRLAIQDLSPAGAQPMTSPSGRYTVVYNGELYNHLELRSALYGTLGFNNWKGTSDTETLLAAVDHWGFPETLKKINGMFAIALWDSSRNSLLLARDRMGEKPLYFGIHNGALLFGSQLRALRQFPNFKPQIDRESVCAFLACSNVPAPRSIYAGIEKLPAGCWVEFRAPSMSSRSLNRYWDLAALTRSTPKTITKSDEACSKVVTQIEQSVKSRMISDVPLGAFLSGGYDSSLVTALMQKHSSEPVKTFTIGFHEAAYNEAPAAYAVAQHLGTDHQELYLTEQDSLDVVPNLSDRWDEPFSDASQIPTLLLAQLTRQHVTVSLSGDGGDELFGGYSRHSETIARWRRMNRLPALVKKAVGHSVEHSSLLVDRCLSNTAMYRNSRIAPLVRVLGTAGRTLSKANFLDTYLHSARNWKQPEKLVLGVSAYTDPVDKTAINNVDGQLTQMMLCDALCYLPDTILTKVDRATMAVGLEARAPLLDHQLVELALQVDDSLKLKGSTGKWILREITHELLPPSLMDRPKMGFGVPIEHWLKGSLREWAEDLLSEDLLKRQGIFSPIAIGTMWREFQAGQWDWHYYLWDVLMFQQWMQTHHAE